MTPSAIHKVTPKTWQRLLSSPLFLFPFIGVVVLIGIWGLTLSFIDSEREATIRAVQVSTYQQTDTYEAHVIRALREIDQTLLFLQYAHDQGRDNYLLDLEQRSLLPPALLFIVTVADAQGRVIFSNRQNGLTNVADEEVFIKQRQFDELAVSKPKRLEEVGAHYVHFSRRLSAENNEFDGVAIVSVESEYFVSSYEGNLLGDNGLLAILDQDGVFIARRSGDVISAGSQTDYSEIDFQTDSEDEVQVSLTVSSWDGVERYVSALELFQFPIAVVVGLSVEEQLSEFYRNRQSDLNWAWIASLSVVLVLFLLGYQNQQLLRVRRRAREVEIANIERIEKMALHDALTGLPNRTLFTQLVNKSLLQAQRKKHQLAVIFLDLDNFKEVNDTLGHDAGDILLKEAALRLKASLRKSDTIARFGGDEFVALMPEIRSAEDARAVAEKIIDAIAKPFFIMSQDCYVSASIGIALYPEDGEDEETLSKKADSAMYISKKEGRNTYRFYPKTTKR